MFFVAIDVSNQRSFWEPLADLSLSLSRFLGDRMFSEGNEFEPGKD